MTAQAKWALKGVFREPRDVGQEVRGMTDPNLAVSAFGPARLRPASLTTVPFWPGASVEWSSGASDASARCGRAEGLSGVDTDSWSLFAQAARRAALVSC